MSNTVSIKDLKQRVLEQRMTKQAAAAASAATDPAEKGVVSATKDPMLTDAKSVLPTNNKENTSNEGKKLEDHPLEPSSTGKNIPISPKDGDAEDKKGVEKVASLKERVRKLAGIGKTATAKPEPAKSEATKTAGVESGEPDLTQLTPSALYKLASAIFETEEGVDAVLPLLRKKAGRDAYVELMKSAADEYYKAKQEAFYAEQLQKQASAEQEEFNLIAQEIIKSASSQEEADRLIKSAAAHFENTKGLNEFEKLAYAQGPEDAAAMMGAEEAGGAPAIEGAGEPTIEQIIQLIALAVQNGELSEEDAQAIAAELMGGAEGGAPEGGAPPAPTEGAPPTEEPAPEPDGDEPVKEASAKSPADLLKKLRNRK